MLTVESAKELAQTNLWRGICEEIDRMITYEMSKFKTCKAEDVVSIQRMIFAYEQVKNIPQIVIDRESE